ncbi:acetylxylan esterase [Microbacterium hydrocarbonoxydans]|uniref:acetylxylan esterase n=1 Tax=Microbacterium hydrocarbonoxydans TaxID=273678 RepID=UPI0007BB9B04|nr:acetylxylan esterase [Microbacterium hydrocarbonoxydans]GAT71560.1 acetyl esterase [Microbacterium sp. HM58-2]
MTFARPYDSWFPDAAFDGTYGRDLGALRRIAPVPPPPGFAERWRGWRTQARSVDAAPVVLSSEERHGRRVSLVEHAGVDGVRLRSWLAMPAQGPARAGVVHGHGYGGRDAVDLRRVPADAAAIFPVARGLGALNAGIGAPQPKEEHVLAGIADPETYVLGLCARDLWLAADALVALAGDVPLYYVGESFGGGIGALAVPWDERFRGATLIVPSFGQYDERLAVTCLGSGETVRAHVAAHPGARETLRWFDASSAIGFADVPIRVEAALWDQYVPPPGQFAVAAGARDLELAVLPAGHAEYPGAHEVTADAVRAGLAHLARALGAS